MNNYRPISIIPVVAKVFERIIYDQLYAYLSDNNMIAAHQSGFRSLHSTVAALLDASNNWAYNIDKGNVNAVLFLDLKRAFDTVDHGILLSKLSSYGVQGNSLKWFKSYLDNRRQKCFINGCFSYSGVVLWNSLPSDLRQAESLVIYSTHFILLCNFCIFRHGVHVKQFLWFYY